MGAWKEPDGNAAREYRKYQESNEENQKGGKRANHNFLWSYKWGPFWQGAAEKPQNGGTDSGAEQQRQRW